MVNNTFDSCETVSNIFFLNGSEFCQKLIGTIIRVLNNDKDPNEVKCHIRAQCAPSPNGGTGPHMPKSVWITLGDAIRKYMLNISRLATNYGTLDAYYLHMDKSILALTTQ